MNNQSNKQANNDCRRNLSATIYYISRENEIVRLCKVHISDLFSRLIFQTFHARMENRTVATCHVESTFYPTNNIFIKYSSVGKIPRALTENLTIFHIRAKCFFIPFFFYVCILLLCSSK